MFGNKKAVLQMPADSSAARGGSMEYGGFWARLVALMVDSAILTIAGIALMVVLGMALGSTGVAIGNIVFLLLQLLYWPVMESSARQATFGKSLMGLQVTDLDGNRTSFLKSLLRNLAKIISSMTFGIGFLIAGFTGRKQALHDIITSCLVLRTGPSGFLKAVAAAVVAFAIAGYGGYYYVTKIYLPQTMESAMGGAGKEFQREMEKAMKGMDKDMARQMEQAMKQAEADMKRQMDKAAREAQKASPPPVAKAPAPTPPPAAAQAPASKPQVAAAAPTPPPAAAPQPASKPQAVAAAPTPAPAPAQIAPAPAKPAAPAVTKAEPAPKAVTAAPSPTGDKPAVKRVVARKPATPAPDVPVTLSTKSPRYNDVMTAVMNRDRAGAVEALDAGVWADRPDSNGVTPLMAAAMYGDAAMVQLLLQYGADPNRSSPAGSPLEHASRGGNAQVIAQLKKAGAR